MDLSKTSTRPFLGSEATWERIKALSPETNPPQMFIADILFQLPYELTHDEAITWEIEQDMRNRCWIISIAVFGADTRRRIHIPQNAKPRDRDWNDTVMSSVAWIMLAKEHAKTQIAKWEKERDA